MLKRYIIMHDTDGFIASIYAERFVRSQKPNSFTGNYGGDFYVGSEIVASIDTLRCRVGNSGVVDKSRPEEDQGLPLSNHLCEELRQENEALSRGRWGGYGQGS